MWVWPLVGRERTRREGGNAGASGRLGIGMDGITEGSREARIIRVTELVLRLSDRSLEMMEERLQNQCSRPGHSLHAAQLRPELRLVAPLRSSA